MKNDEAFFLSTKNDPNDAIIIEKDVAKPFRILSAYFIVAAIRRPPPKKQNLCKKILFMKTILISSFLFIRFLS